MFTPETNRIFSDPASSGWLKRALQEALNRDPVDALNDAEVLVQVLRDRLEAIQSIWGKRS